jgi:pimeloyl-ACP methyl ester carboxylesterase
MIGAGELGPWVRVRLAIKMVPNVRSDCWDGSDDPPIPPFFKLELNGEPPNGGDYGLEDGQLFAGWGEETNLEPDNFYCCGYPRCICQGMLDPGEHLRNHASSPPAQSSRDRPPLNKCLIITRYFPITAVNFPDRAGVLADVYSGNDVPPFAETTLAIEDENGSKCYCIKVMWASLEIQAMSPVVLIHGSSQQGEWWDRDDFKLGLNTAGTATSLSSPSRHMIVNNESNMPGGKSSDGSITGGPGQALVLTNAIWLARHDSPGSASPPAGLPRIARKYGVDSLHIVAHSKGGLDTRAYLELFSRNRARLGKETSVSRQQGFDALSLITLSTPHGGSVLADLMDLRHKDKRATVITSPLPNAGTQTVYEILRGQRIVSHENLTTRYLSDFNATNVRNLPSNMLYACVGADADINYTESIDDDFEARNLQRDNSWLERRAIFAADYFLDRVFTNETSIEALAADGPYQFVGKVSQVFIVNNIVPYPPFSYPAISGQILMTHRPNDALVSTASAIGQGTRFSSVPSDVLLRSGHNHSTLNKSEIAKDIRPWIMRAERDFGDWRLRW